MRVTMRSGCREPVRHDEQWRMRKGRTIRSGCLEHVRLGAHTWMISWPDTESSKRLESAGTVGQYMPRNRFQHICQNLYFSDNLDDRAKTDQVYCGVKQHLAESGIDDKSGPAAGLRHIAKVLPSPRKHWH
ncbi:TPA: hypothetical protein N0F65_003664, partial [Lagenidium giganteum]